MTYSTKNLKAISTDGVIGDKILVNDGSDVTIGDDVFLYISSSANKKTLFTGDVHISGNLTVLDLEDDDQNDVGFFFSKTAGIVEQSGSLHISGNFAAQSITGSYTQIEDGVPWLVAGNQMTVSHNANGQWTIGSTATATAQQYFFSDVANEIRSSGSLQMSGNLNAQNIEANDIYVLGNLIQEGEPFVNRGKVPGSGQAFEILGQFPPTNTSPWTIGTMFSIQSFGNNEPGRIVSIFDNMSTTYGVALFVSRSGGSPAWFYQHRNNSNTLVESSFGGPSLEEGKTYVAEIRYQSGSFFLGVNSSNFFNSSLPQWGSGTPAIPAIFGPKNIVANAQSTIHTMWLHPSATLPTYASSVAFDWKQFRFPVSASMKVDLTTDNGGQTQNSIIQQGSSRLRAVGPGTTFWNEIDFP